MEYNEADILCQSEQINENKSLGYRVAQFISFGLHPLLITMYGIALLFVYTDFQYLFIQQFDKFMIPVIVFSCFLPLTGLYFLKRMKYVSDFSLEKKEERFLPFLIFFISYMLLFFYFQKAGLYTWFLSILLVPLILLIIFGIITVFWRLSVHMAGAGALLGVVFSVCYNIKGLNPYLLFVILIILAGALGVSRLILNKHTPAQVYVGFLIGLIVSYATVFVGGYYQILNLYMK